MKITVQELAKKINARLIGDSTVEITALGEIDECEKSGILVFAVDNKSLKKLRKYQPRIVVLREDIPDLKAVKLIVDKDKEIIIDLLHIFYPEKDQTGFISNQATVAKSADIGKNARIFPGVVIGENVVIGDNTIIYPNVVIYDGCRIGNNCIVHANTTIGADGFGYIFKDGKHLKVPQKGIVIIEDNVEIGANTAIDRATFKATIIGAGTKIDNFVQIAHNVKIGKNCILVGGVQIPGSVIIEDNVIMAGAAASVDNVTIGHHSIIYARTVVTKDCPPNSKIYATPAGEDYTEAMKKRALYNKLPGLFAKVKDLETKFNEG